jgi:hypothetical protein
MGFSLTGTVIMVVLAALVIYVLYTVSTSKRPCPYCHTMMPKKADKCPHCRKSVPLGY